MVLRCYKPNVGGVLLPKVLKNKINHLFSA
jgi:hypothetical protein